MANSRPKIVSTNTKQFCLDLPRGWFATLSGVSRRTYNQLVVAEYEFLGETELRFLANEWNKPNQVMYDSNTGGSQITFVPQDEDIKGMKFNFYYSERRGVSGNDLEDPKYASNKYRTFVSDKPDDAPEEMPDYMTVLVFVEDAPDSAQVAGQQQYDDLVLTIHMVYAPAVTAPPPIDTGTAALTEQGKQAIKAFLDRYIRPGEPYPSPPPPYQPTPELAKLPVGILGAGVSGLYIGMMLDSLGIKYEIMEGSDRIGGRLYTHNFPKNQGKYQYFDVGAMRYPRTAFMKRTFDLVEKRLNKPNAFIPYIRTNENTFLTYNDITTTRKLNGSTPKSNDIFRVSQANGGNVPNDYVSRGTSMLFDEGLKEFRDNFKNLPFQEAYEKMMEYDGYSTSSYLQQVKGYPIDVINWFESMESLTGILDGALSATVLMSLTFNDPKQDGADKMKWFCFDGGSEVLHRAMTEALSSKPVLYQRATIIEESDDGNSVTVTFDARRHPNPSAQVVTKRKYSNVISTMSFSCLRMLDLKNAGLNYGQKNAIRSLQYSPSVKVGMQFKSAWWERLNIVGGQSSSDLPIRNVVYPSYGPDDSHKTKGEKSNCFIASYSTGSQDPARLGGLIHGRDTAEERAMLDLIMRNLAQVHNVDVQMLWDEFEDYYPWNWQHDSFQLGAFGAFGPGQFKYIYPYMQQPAGTKQRLHFAGDVTSTFHGWVAGSLNSAWRSVMGMLISHPELNPNPKEDIIKKFQDLWGKSEEMDNVTLETVVNLGRSMPKTQAGVVE